MTDYLNGKIYKIGCNITGEIYIGSTTKSLEDRLGRHIRECNRCSSKQIIDRNAYYIEQLEAYPCNSKYELVRKEGEYQKAFKCVNTNIAGRTKQEYNIDNKDRIVKYKQEYDIVNKDRYVKYRLDNAKKIATRQGERVTCECGSIIRCGDLPRHTRTKKHLKLMANLN